MTTLSSLNAVNPLAYTPASTATNSMGSTLSVASQDPASAPASTNVTIPSPGSEAIGVYTPQGLLDGPPPMSIAEANNSADPVSVLMMQNILAGSLSGRLQNLGSTLLDNLGTIGSNFSQMVTAVAPGGEGDPATQGAQSDIKLNVETMSGIDVSIEIESENGTLGVTVHSSGTLSAAENNAMASLANGFQQAINGLSAAPPTLDLSGLTQYDPSVLSSVSMQVNVMGDPANTLAASFSENSSSRSVSLTDSAGKMNLNVDTSHSALLGTGTQRSQAIAHYLQQFDNANTEGHGNAAMMTLFKDAFTQLNSVDEAASSTQKPAGATDTSQLAQTEQAMLTGLDDFTASISDTSDVVDGKAGAFSYRVSQSTKTQGDQQNGTISQTQQSDLNAAYRKVPVASEPQNYDDLQIDDNTSSTVQLATQNGNLTQASLSQSSSQSTRDSKYLAGKLVSDVTKPTKTSDSQDLLAQLNPLIASGQATPQSSAWQQALSAVHGMILLNASAN
jgi:hypothetical protein